MQSMDNSWYVFIRQHLTTGRKYTLIKKYMLNKDVRLLTRLHGTRPLIIVVHMSRKHMACMHYALSRHCLYIDVPTKRLYLWCSWTMSLYLKHTEASFPPNLIDSLCLWVSRLSRIRDKMAIFVPATTTTTQPIASPLAHVHGIIMCTIMYYSINQ